MTSITFFNTLLMVQIMLLVIKSLLMNALTAGLEKSYLN